MRVYISGKEHHRCSHKELRYACNWFGHILMSSRLCKSLSVSIHLVKSDFHFMDYLGDMCWLDDNVSPRRFEIELNASQSKKSLLQTLAHEMVHVKQYATGELKSLFNRKENRWKNQYISESVENYFDLPWEVEAYGREIGLYVRYNHFIKKNKIDVNTILFSENIKNMPKIYKVEKET